MKTLFSFFFLGLFINGSLFAQDISQDCVQYVSHSAENRLDTTTCIKYSIKNNLDEVLLLMFVEEDITENDKDVLIRKKLLRRYGSLSLSMLAWDNVAPLEGLLLCPEFFAKILKKGDTFDIFIVTDKPERMKDFCQRHLLVCSEKELINHPTTSFRNIPWAIQSSNYEYKDSFIVFKEEILLQFIAVRRES